MYALSLPLCLSIFLALSHTLSIEKRIPFSLFRGVRSFGLLHNTEKKILSTLTFSGTRSFDSSPVNRATFIHSFRSI